MKTLLRELHCPGQYFELELFSNYIFIMCYPKLARGQTKFQFPDPYVLELPLYSISQIYNIFAKLRLKYKSNKVFLMLG